MLQEAPVVPLLWWAAGPGAAFGRKMAHVSLWYPRGRDQPLRLGYVNAARAAK